MAYKILIDTNVLLDYVLERDPDFENALALINSCVEKKSVGRMAAHSIPNMFFIMGIAIRVTKEGEFFWH